LKSARSYRIYDSVSGSGLWKLNCGLTTAAARESGRVLVNHELFSVVFSDSSVLILFWNESYAFVSIYYSWITVWNREASLVDFELNEI
jgi:hypothetical protein